LRAQVDGTDARNIWVWHGPAVQAGISLLIGGLPALRRADHVPDSRGQEGRRQTDGAWQDAAPRRAEALAVSRSYK
jgi:hypothetical protein